MVSWISQFVAAANNPRRARPRSSTRTRTGGRPARATPRPSRPATRSGSPTTASPAPRSRRAGSATRSGRNRSAPVPSAVSPAPPADIDLMQGAPPSVTAVSGASGSVQVETLNSLAGQPVSYAPAGSLPSYLSLSADGPAQHGRPSTPAGVHSVTVTPTSTAATPATVIPSSVSATIRVHGTVAISTANRSSTAGTPISLKVTTLRPRPERRVRPHAQGDRAARGPLDDLSWFDHRLGDQAGHVQGRRLPRPTALAELGPALVHLDGQCRRPTLAPPGRSGRWAAVASAWTTRRSNTANGTHIDLSSCTGKLEHRWTTVQDGTLRTGGKCLSSARDSTSNGAKLVLETCNSRDGAAALAARHGRPTRQPAVGQVPGCPGRQRRQRHPARDRALRQLD